MKMRNDIRKKLNSKRGASFIIAFVFMMICMVVGALIVTAAVSNITKSQNRMGDEQAYLAASSAAKLVAEELDDLGYTAYHKDTEYTCKYHKDIKGDWTSGKTQEEIAASQVDPEKCIFSDYINQWTFELIKNERAEPPLVKYTMEPSAADSVVGQLKEFETTVELQMFDDYSLKATVLSTNGESEAQMVVNVASSYNKAKEDEASVEVDVNADKHSAGKDKILVNDEWIIAKVDTYYDVKHITYTRKLTWGTPVISEGL